MLARPTFLTFSLIVLVPFIASFALAGEVIRGGFGARQKPGTSSKTSANTSRASGSALTHLRFQLHVETQHEAAIPMIAQVVTVLMNTMPEGVLLASEPSEDFEFVIEVSDVKTINADGLEPHQAQKAILENLPADVEHYTLIPSNAPRGPYIVRLFWDRLVYKMKDGERVERSDLFTHVLAALAHEIYGNVHTAVLQRKLLEDPSHRYSSVHARADQLLFERSAFELGVQALKRIRKEAQREKIPSDVQEQINRTLANETLGLSRWTMAPRQSSMSPVADSSSSVVTSLTGARCERLFVSKK